MATKRLHITILVKRLYKPQSSSRHELGNIWHIELGHCMKNCTQKEMGENSKAGP